MQVAPALLSAVSILLILSISACGDSPKENTTEPAGQSALDKAAAEASKEAPIEAGMGEYVTPGASADSIMYAAREGNAELVKLLISENADVNFALPDGLCSLHVAAAGGYIDVVRVLLENKANPNARQAAGATALVAAIQAKNLDIIKLLLEYKADPNLGLANGRFPLMMFDEFQWDRSTHVELAELLGQGGANLNQRLSPKDNTALMIYTAMGNPLMVKWLLSQGAKINLKGNGGFTAVAFAAIGNNPNRLEVAQILGEAGADMSILTDGDLTPLAAAELAKEPTVIAYFKQLEAKQAKEKEAEGE
jgi:ankyrin repeat protein